MSAAVNKRSTESKYVSLFADSRPDVDVTFKDPLLTRPTSHFVVGIDNLTVCSQALSMIEPLTTTNGTDLLRIVRKPTTNAAAGDNRGLDLYHGATAQNPAGDQTFAENATAGSFAWIDIRQDLADAYIPSSEQIMNIGHLMERLQTVAASVNSAMSKNQVNQRLSTQPGQHAMFAAYTSPQAEQDDANGTAGAKDHLQFRLSRSGKLVIEGTKAFWSLCAIEVPSVQNQFGFYSSVKQNVGPFYKDTGRRFLTVDPRDETVSFANMVASRVDMATGSTENPVPAGATPARVLAVARVFHTDGTDTHLQQDSVTNNVTFLDGQHAQALQKIAVTLSGNVFLGLERRVAIELGTSLPIKNSPMIAHQEEYPDFVIGRWLFRSENQYRVNDKGEQSTYGTDASATREYQSAQDRVVFHELMPQSKVQTLRVRLFARVRTFDEDLETYNVRCIQLPTNPEDWWHGRLHFVSKD